LIHFFKCFGIKEPPPPPPPLEIPISSVGGVSGTAQSIFHFCQHQYLKNGKQPKKQNKTKQNKKNGHSTKGYPNSRRMIVVKRVIPISSNLSTVNRDKWIFLRYLGREKNTFIS